ncbi:MAG: putative sporulation protein YtxC [Clostridia bacterium]|nr:putative sporulation protein YtxC [Clostridia bacterium]
MHTIKLLVDHSNELFDTTLKNNISDKVVFNKINSSEYAIYSNDSDFLKLKISEILTEYILTNYEYSILKNIILSDYFYLTNDEKLEILDKAYSLITTNENEFLKMLIILKRRFLIKQSVLDLLNETSEINIDGFVNFRLKNYKNMLTEVVEKVTKDFILQKEYKEFIDMLKYFVDTQAKRTSKVHIVFENNGRYTILNDHNHDITSECFEEFGDAKRSNNLTNEDLLISSLISLAPKKVFIQLTSENYNQKILKTIMQIFENKTFIVDNTPVLEVVR